MRVRLAVYSCALVCGLSGGLPASAQEASMTRILEFMPKDIAADGKTVAGTMSIDYPDGSFLWQPVLWTPEGGLRNLGSPDGDRQMATANAISADGRFVVGEAHNPSLGFRWSEEEKYRILDIQPYGGFAEAVSGDGSRIAGSASVWMGWAAYTWTEDGGVRSLGTFDGVEGFGDAYGVSTDGKYVVGRAMAADGLYHPFRWSEAEGLEDLGVRYAQGNLAQGVSADGSLIVGYGWDERNLGRAFIWTESEGMRDLEPTWNHTHAFDTSNDGSIIVGSHVWTDEEPRTLIEVMENDYGVSMEGWEWTWALRCSSDGTALMGYGTFEGQQYQNFIARLPLAPQMEGEIVPPEASPVSASTSSARSPSLASSVPVQIKHNAMIRVRVGQSVDLAFSALDPGGDDLRFFASGVPEEAVLTPRPGDPVDDAFEGTLTWTPTRDDLGMTRFVHLYVRDVEGRRASLRFNLRAVPAVAPTVEPLEAVVVECAPGANRVKLQTTVDDVEGDRLVVTWKVDGKTKKTEAVDASSVVAFQHDYPHGQSVVDVEVSDDGDPVVASTTVTVQDTTDPIVVVARRETVPVQPGELFARKSSLKAPLVEDACDEAPRVTNDAPAKLPVGTSTVKWTVRDASGNVVQASQTVVVVNEHPVADAGATIRKATETNVATVRLNGSKSYDPDRHDLKYVWRAKGVRFDDPKSARPKGEFPIGSTDVTLTVTDEGGRRSNDTVKVVVRKQTAGRPRAAAARIHAANAYEIAARTPTTELDLAAKQHATAAQILSVCPDSQAYDRATYDQIRARQAAHSEQAAASFYGAYLAGGDEADLLAAVESYRSMLHAAIDAAER